MPDRRTKSEVVNDILEAGYWRYDAMVKGYGLWNGLPHTERDAFKLASSWTHQELSRIS